MKIINRPWWWTILLFLPIVNLIMFAVVWVETGRSFGKHSNLDSFLAVLTLGFYNFYLNYFTEVEHIKDRSLPYQHHHWKKHCWLAIFFLLASLIMEPEYL